MCSMAAQQMPFAFCANYGCSSRWVLLYLSWGNQVSWHKIPGLPRFLYERE